MKKMKKLTILVIGAVLVGLVVLPTVPGFAFGWKALVEKTGQTECWDEDGMSIPCPGTGQDGDLQRGVSWPEPRFKDRGNGWVKDKLTGLEWLKDANCFDGTDTWQKALDFVDDLNAGTVDCEQTNKPWKPARLPNVKELQSLIDFGTFNPALWTPHPFADIQSTWYWSSTTRAFRPWQAWVVDLYDGITAVELKEIDQTYYVWPVRGGIGW